MSKFLYTAFDEYQLDRLHDAWQQRVEIALFHQRIALLTHISRDLFSQYPQAESFTLVGTPLAIHVSLHNDVTNITKALPGDPLLDGRKCTLHRTSVEIN